MNEDDEDAREREKRCCRNGWGTLKTCSQSQKELFVKVAFLITSESKREPGRTGRRRTNSHQNKSGVLHKELREFKAKGWIRPSKSEWATVALVLPKKDNT